MSLETRVGMMTIRIIKEQTMEYIKVYTSKQRYHGDLKYLTQYNSCDQYLKGEQL